jgi:TonB family protein
VYTRRPVMMPELKFWLKSDGLAILLAWLSCLSTTWALTASLAPYLPQTDSAHVGRVAVEQRAMEQRLTHRVEPVYPPLARQANIQGTVVFRIFVGKDGSVQNLKLVSGHPLLVPAAQEAVHQWRYDPVLVNGKPVEVESAVDVPMPPVPPGPPPGPGVAQYRENTRLHPDDAGAHYQLGVALNRPDL